MRPSSWAIGLVLVAGCTVDGLPYPYASTADDAGGVVEREDVAPEIPLDRPVAVDHPAIVDDASIRIDAIGNDSGRVDVQPAMVPDAAVCIHPPGRCRTDSDCCTNACITEYCDTSGQGFRCSSNIDCDNQAPCLGGRCQCQVNGGHCLFESECCSFDCDRDTHVCS